MKKVTLRHPGVRPEAADRFSLFRRIGAARVTKLMLVALDNVFSAEGVQEAQRSTQRWFAHRRRTEDTPDIADATLAYYERAVRQFRPYYELDYESEGEERTVRYHGLEPFLRWAGRQRRLKPSAFRILYAVPSLRIQIYLRHHFAGNRSYVFGEGLNITQLERTVDAVSNVLANSARKKAFINRWSVPLAGGIALPTTVALALRFHELPLAAILFDATALDVGLVFALLGLIRGGWPQIDYDLGTNRRAGRQTIFRAAAALVVGTAALTAAWALATTFLKITF